MNSKSVSDDGFVGARLQLAREFRGLTQTELGKMVSASVTLISFCETTKKKNPSSDLVEAFASVLEFKRQFFYEPIEDLFLPDECHFRHRRAAAERLKTRIRAHATLIGSVVKQLRKHLSLPKLNLPRFQAASSTEIEAAAKKARLHWALDPEAPINQVGRVLERAGVIIVPGVVDTSQIDAFSRQGLTSIIFLNKSIQSPSRWTFDIAHECGHLVMHSGTATGCIETEAAADRFASSFLMPAKAFSREFGHPRFSWEHIFQLKQRWHASAAAIVRRAYDLDLIDAVTYRRAFQSMSFKGWRSNGEPHEPKFQEPELLDAAFSSLGGRVEATPASLCEALHFTPKTFFEVTGYKLSEPAKAATRVIRFPSRKMTDDIGEVVEMR